MTSCPPSKSLPPLSPTDWHVEIHVEGALDSLPRPACVHRFRADEPRRCDGGTPAVAARPHSSFLYTLAGCGMVRDARGEHLLSSGCGYLCRFPDPDHVHWSLEGPQPWQAVYIDWLGAEDTVDELTGRYGSFFRLTEMPPAVEALLAYAPYDGRIVAIDARAAAELVMPLLMAYLDAIRATPADEPARRLTRRARRLIHEHAESDLNVNGIAALLGVSPEHLCRAFQAETGQSPRECLMREKMRRACRLLVVGDLPCADIARRLGYSTSANFARAFRRATGMSPSDFRKRGEIW